jgi:hypothetical protein
MLKKEKNHTQTSIIIASIATFASAAAFSAAAFSAAPLASASAFSFSFASADAFASAAAFEMHPNVSQELTYPTVSPELFYFEECTLASAAAFSAAALASVSALAY